MIAPAQSPFNSGESAMFMRMLGAAVVLLASSSAFAQGASAQRAACTTDVWRLCSSEIPNINAIVGCLGKQRATLSPACRQVMDSSGQTAARPAGQSPFCAYDSDNPLEDDWRKWCGKGAWKQ
jgi:hypothetical protein